MRAWKALMAAAARSRQSGSGGSRQLPVEPAVPQPGRLRPRAEERGVRRDAARGQPTPTTRSSDRDCCPSICHSRRTSSCRDRSSCRRAPTCSTRGTREWHGHRHEHRGAQLRPAHRSGRRARFNWTRGSVSEL